MQFLEKKWKGQEFRFFVYKTKKGLWLHYKGETWFWKNQGTQFHSIKVSSKKKKELLKAQLPGRIQKIFIQKLQRVKKGQTLLTLSAMKIEYSFKAEGEAVVEDLFCKEGESVSLDQNLIKIKYDE
ncbi:MAG: acetyl-CoA carboxylase biotin carboxyl carrier protein subunit [Bdellovibrionales bacterium]|nr:acetyl-CoA carboxylase biotin carboxyl carrier protein subunit [Bdellovibrionales bacterium]